ncbi:hypothetical protein ACJ2A9_21190 [Anaerobacillus sp. MEB173]|uniref:hypothetical protein n=1 Tax=Anaerobacillus sp. MEB173 TaxID=3383345 RepID=UPI003F8FBD3C
MKLQEPELKCALIQFESLMRELPDRRESLPQFKKFILFFLRIKTRSVPLPTSEIMSILKREKPTLFSIMRRELSNNLIFNIITHIDAEYWGAKKRLNELLQKLKS